MTTSTNHPPNWPRTVAEIMRREIVTIRPEASLNELVELLDEHGVSGLPVVERSGRAVGMVSVSDLLWRLGEVEAAVRERGHSGCGRQEIGLRSVRDVMTPDLFGVASTASLDELLAFFARTGLHRALVLEGDHVIGIVSGTDLLSLIARGGKGVGAGVF